MDRRIRVTTCKTGDRRLLDEVFESKPIKRGGKNPSGQPKKSFEFQSTSTKCLSTTIPTTTTPSPPHPVPQIHMSQENSTTWTKHK